MLLMLMESVRNELQFAVKSTGQSEFKKAINFLNEAISLVESNQPDQASAEDRHGNQCIHDPCAGSVAGA